jgi:hypothetical protein
MQSGSFYMFDDNISDSENVYEILFVWIIDSV